MTKDEFVHQLEVARQAWEMGWKGVDLFDPNGSTAPGQMDLRDIAYHVAWYEREMVEVLAQRAVVGSPWWDLPLDERNAHILAEGRSVELLQAYLQEKRVYEQLLELVKGLSEEELNDPGCFREMPAEWKPWEMLASNTWEHYPDHLQDIQPK